MLKQPARKWEKAPASIHPQFKDQQHSQTACCKTFDPTGQQALKKCEQHSQRAM
jgi:hypothetical protein